MPNVNTTLPRIRKQFLTSSGFTFHDVSAVLPCSLQCARQNVKLLHEKREITVARWKREPHCRARWTAIYVFDDTPDVPRPPKAPKDNKKKRMSKLRRSLGIPADIKIEAGMGQLKSFKDHINACFGQPRPAE